MAQDRPTYLKEYHAEHQEEGVHDKAKQRQRDNVVMFHVKRLVLYSYALPDWVAKDEKRVERMRQQLEDQMDRPVEVEVNEI